MEKKQFLATDFDGTLYRGGCVSSEDYEAIRRWRESGRIFGFVTGRGLDFPKISRKLGLSVDFYICYNGALLLDGTGRILHEARIDRSEFQSLEEVFSQKGQAVNYSLTREEKNFFQYNALMSDAETAAAFSEELNVCFDGRVTAYANGRNINVVRKGESKEQGVCHALNHFGLARKQAAVVGDDLNDLDMILKLDGWTVSSGHPQVLECAPHICSSVGEMIDMLLSEG